MSADLSALQMKYDSVMTMDSLDTTYDGRKLFHIVIGDRKAERQVLVFHTWKRVYYFTISDVPVGRYFGTSAKSGGV